MATARVRMVARAYTTGPSSLSQTQTFGVANTALLPVNLSVTVIGAPGVTAAFPNSRTAKRVPAHGQTTVVVTTNPMHAGSLNGGSVQISVTGVAKPLS